MWEQLSAACAHRLEPIKLDTAAVKVIEQLV